MIDSPPNCPTCRPVHMTIPWSEKEHQYLCERCNRVFTIWLNGNVEDIWRRRTPCRDTEVPSLVIESHAPLPAPVQGTVPHTFCLNSLVTAIGTLECCLPLGHKGKHFDLPRGEYWI